jgi:hypothetical protein
MLGLLLLRATKSYFFRLTVGFDLPDAFRVDFFDLLSVLQTGFVAEPLQPPQQAGLLAFVSVLS